MFCNHPPLSCAEIICVTKHMLLAEAAAEGQKRGRPGQLVDPRPQTVEGGEIKIVITPQLVHDIFDEFPVVAKAYNDNVPNKVCSMLALITAYLKRAITSYQRPSSGRDISSPNCSMHTAPPSARPLRSML